MTEHDVVALLLDWVRTRHFGKYRGEVVKNTDETKRGRLLVRVPAVLGELEVWAMPCVPYAGKEVGLFALPPEKAGVWIEFEGGDASYPIWVGCFWADDENPAKGDPAVKLWKTGQHTIRLDDGAKEIHVLTSEEAEITMKDKIIAEAGKSKLTIDSAGLKSASTGTGKLEVTPGAVVVNGGSLEVT